MDWNGAALTLMPPLCRGLEPDWNCVLEAGGRSVVGGACSVRGIEAYTQNDLHYFFQAYIQMSPFVIELERRVLTCESSEQKSDTPNG